MDGQKKVLTYQEIGAGDPPLLWKIGYWPDSSSDTDFLTGPMYWHLADQLCELARAVEPTRCPTLDIEKIEDFWELKEKGGVLGKTNVRVYFHVNTSPKNKEIVVLGVHKKEDEGQVRKSVLVRIRRRLRNYRDSVTSQRGGA